MSKRGSAAGFSKRGSQVTAKSATGVKTAGPAPKKGLEKPKKGLEWTLPAFSVCKKPKTGIDWEEVKKKLIRRQAPEGEDIKAIRLVLKELKDKTIPIHDFINLVSAYTSDNGHELRECLVEDMKNFQIMCRKIYQTMTQDISDVLINDQLLTVEFYQQKHDIGIERMMRAINEIYDMAPTFDFQKYYISRENYLNQILPIPAKSQEDPEVEHILKRQQLYHRLQWLRNEGERMFEENKRLQNRLHSLKRQQEMEQMNASQAAEAAEAKAAELEKEEEKMRNTLQQLNVDMEKSIIANEAEDRITHNETTLQPPKKEDLKERKKKKPKKRPDWASVVAEEIDVAQVQEAVANENESIPLDTSLRKLKLDSTLEQSRLESTTTSRARSKISFNPKFNSTEMPETSSNVVQQTKIEKSNIRQQKERQRGRVSLAPRDTWGGYH
ncbi:uncharacterized protein LOC130900143 [Diorhabda carinulata]|uniref:uncharacterized protein LOC130900143 n=1 Tax=Diorhabda carinulata TaxID=1163345 RepID=UPI00259FFC44|nr:uncharacterized protein LOC130900143 [Diorhabda carinulata]